MALDLWQNYTKKNVKANKEASSLYYAKFWLKFLCIA